MNRVVISLILLLCCGANQEITAQQPTSPFPFRSYARTLNVAPNGSMVITTKGGEVAYTDSVKGIWRSISPMDKGEKSYGWLLERTNLFNKDTAFTSGFIENKGKYDVIYRTENGGRNWTAVYFGQDGWIDATASLFNGEAWMSIAGKGIAHTVDYGKTWEIASPAVNGTQRYSKMFFNRKGEGIMGSVWNSLAYSVNSGKSWKLLATPLDQKKYNKTNPNQRPEFNDVAIFRNYLLVKQEDMVFMADKDSLVWKHISNIDNFYADPEHDDLYLRMKDKSVVHVNERLDTVTIGKVTGDPFSGVCVNGKLYLLALNSVIGISGNDGIQQYPILSDQAVVMEPEIFGMSANGKYYYGISGNVIYRKKVEKDKWTTLQTLSLSPDMNTLTFNGEKNEIAFYTNDSVYHVDIDNGNMRANRKGEYLSLFQQHPVNRVIVSTGSHGCFHQYSDNLEYQREGNEYVLMDNNSQGTKHTNQLNTTKETINAEDVKRLVKAVCNDYNRMPGIADFGFTQKEYDQCKKDIQAFNVNRKIDDRPGKENTGFYIRENNVDFNKLILLVDSIKTLDSAAMGKILLNSDHMRSTTTDWMAISLVNDNGETLRIQYSYTEQPNAMRLPCALIFNEERLLVFTPAITSFLESNCPALMKDRNRMPLLYDMVRYLYSGKAE